jgi:hypothetical protein
MGPEDIAGAFNSFFLTTAENLNMHQELIGAAISILRETYPKKFPGIKTIPTTQTGIKSIKHSLKAKHSEGYVGIKSKMLRVCASLMSDCRIDD